MGRGIMTSELKRLPSVDRMLAHPKLAELTQQYVRVNLVEAIRAELKVARQAALEGAPVPTIDELVESVVIQTETAVKSWPVSVINATGVVLHTNLGRAPLSMDSIEAMNSVAQGYSNLELDLEDGRRGSRQQALAPLLCRLTGAEDALVVNNNAGAVLLGLAAMASNKQVMVSRSEAVEIGGGFRVPDVLRQSGAQLVEVGTTNRTYVRDYENAITVDTGALLVVHRSNFKVVGFTHQPELTDLVALAKSRELPLLYDLGSGALLRTEMFGLAHEPMVQESVSAGVDLVFFSGDKLLGGPQAGIVVGRTKAIQQLARHPWARALRADKFTLAALHATLVHYLRGEVLETVPIWQMVSQSIDQLHERAQSWAKVISNFAQVETGTSTIGGGSLPGEVIQTQLLSIDGRKFEGGADAVARKLRQWRKPIMVRIEDEHVLLDPRTVLLEQEEELRSALSSLILP